MVNMCICCHRGDGHVPATQSPLSSFPHHATCTGDMSWRLYFDRGDGHVPAIQLFCACRIPSSSTGAGALQNMPLSLGQPLVTCWCPVCAKFMLSLMVHMVVSSAYKLHSLHAVMQGNAEHHTEGCVPSTRRERHSTRQCTSSLGSLRIATLHLLAMSICLSFRMMR